MIEAIIRDYLLPILKIPVMTEHQHKDPDTFVIIERVGGSMANRVRSATVAIQSYGQSMIRAAELHEAVMNAMDGIRILDEIGGISLNSEYNYTDEEMKQYRYQAVYDIIYYG